MAINDLFTAALSQLTGGGTRPPASAPGQMAAPSPQMAAPQPGPMPAGGPAPAPAPRNLPGEWQQFLGNPDARRFLIQFGLNALQPVGVGQSTLGHLAQSAGAGLEANQRVADRQREQQVEDENLRLRQEEVDARREATRASTSRTGSLTADQLLDNQWQSTTRLWDYIKLVAEADANRAALDTGNPYPDTQAAIAAILDDPVRLEEARRHVETLTGRQLPRTGGVPGQEEGPPMEAISYLLKNPHLAPQFDEMYGQGAAARYLNG